MTPIRWAPAGKEIMQSTGEPLVFWRETEKGKRGLACRVEFCENPDCACQNAYVQAFEVDERFEGLVARGRILEVQYRGNEKPPEHARVDAIADLETGSVGPAGDTPSSGREAELLAWLRDACDEATMGELRRRWSVFKDERKKEAEALARRTWKDQDWTGWDGEERVGWAEVAPSVSEDLYEIENLSYEAADYYCVRPGCNCDTIAVRFFGVGEGEHDSMIGEVLVEASSNEVVGTDNAPGKHRTLVELFTAYESQHDLSALSRRNEEMLSIGPELHALRKRQLRASSGGSVGRNTPCPCGSGKKYKKCCGRSC